MDKLLFIGLDCATPQLVFDAWRDELPHLDFLMKHGVHGELQSCIPPITVPAWTAMMSSKDPGELGFYGFRNRKSHRYEELYFANASYNNETMLWNYLEKAGKRSVLIGVPQTYPPRQLNGIVVGCFLTPDKSADYTYPAGIKDDLDAIADGDYIIDVKDFRTDNKDWLLDQIYRMTERRFKVVRHYLHSEAWDFFMFVEMGIDRMHHAFWRYQDAGHRLYEPDSPYSNAIRSYYRYVDRQIGNLLDGLEPGTTVVVASDHGAKKMVGAICVNEWLMQKGYLRLNKPLDGPVKLTPDMIDWKKTRAWGEGGYYSRVFFNVKDREPEGVVTAEEYEAFRNRLKEEIESLGDEEGRPIGTRVFKPEDVYRTVRNIAPDLIVYFGDLDWRAAGKVGTGRIHVYENDTGPDDSNHAEKGIFILKTDPSKLTKAGLSEGQQLDGLSLYDVAPTILDCFRLPTPSGMIGKSILNGVSRSADYLAGSIDPSETKKGYSLEDEEKIKKHLEELGYI